MIFFCWDPVITRVCAPALIFSLSHILFWNVHPLSKCQFYMTSYIFALSLRGHPTLPREEFLKSKYWCSSLQCSSISRTSGWSPPPLIHQDQICDWAFVHQNTELLECSMSNYSGLEINPFASLQVCCALSRMSGLLISPFVEISKCYVGPFWGLTVIAF